MVQAGDEGCILDTRDVSGSKLCYITIPRRNTQGWVPMSQKYLSIGQAIYGRVTMKGDFPIAPINVQITPTIDITNALYPRTVYATLVAFSQNAGQILLSDEYAGPIASDHYRKELTNRIEHAARQAGGLQTLNQPDFSLTELIKSLAAVNRQQDRGIPGDYIQALRDFRNQPERRPEIRLGKTGDLVVRYDSHEVDRVAKQNEPFYGASGEATFYGMYVLHRGLDDDDARTWAEQITVLQLGAYRSNVISPATPLDSAHTVLNKARRDFS
jgi:hypothetical protein